MNLKQTLLPVVCAALFCGCAPCKDEMSSPASSPKFKKMYTFFTPSTKEEVELMKKYHVAGTAVGNNPEGIKLLNEAGIGAYIGFGPEGWHRSVMNKEEQKVYDYLKAADVPVKDREKESKRRKSEGRYSYGGEPLPGAKFIGHTEVLEWPLPCIIGEKARKTACEKLDKMCAVPGIDGVSFDYVGYSNYRGCEHPECLKLCAEYLKKNNLPDTEENRGRFYLHELAEYYRVCAEHIRKINPRFKIMAHLYPVFLPEPLYGNRLDIDIAGETCAWYRIWDVKKVEEYARYIVENQHKYHKNTQCVPFLAVTTSDFSDIKTPEIIDRELQAILKSGTDSLMIHEFHSLIKSPEFMAVFDKYFE